MPSLRIPFPEKETSSTLVLKGSRITVGRRSENTIQILDRTLSGTHAEFVSEPDGHYRLHDLGSTNGTSVNGETVADFHLREACTIRFGSVACEFDPVAAAGTESGEAEVLPTRSEMESLRQVNEEMRRNLEVLREEVTSLKGAQVATTGESEAEVLKAELQRVVVERGELKEAAEKQLLELARLQSELALVKRDRTNLQNALRLANGAELDRVKRDQAGQAAKNPAPAAGTTEVLAGAAGAMAAAMNITPEKPAAAPAPVKALPPAPKPVLPPPSAPSYTQAAFQNGRPAAPSGGAGKPAAQAGARSPAQPTARAVPSATSKAPVAVSPAAGPTGTARLDRPSAAQASGQPTERLSPASAKLPPKFVPPVRQTAKREEGDS